MVGIYKVGMYRHLRLCSNSTNNQAHLHIHRHAGMQACKVCRHARHAVCTHGHFSMTAGYKILGMPWNPVKVPWCVSVCVHACVRAYMRAHTHLYWPGVIL